MNCNFCNFYTHHLKQLCAVDFLQNNESYSSFTLTNLFKRIREKHRNKNAFVGIANTVDHFRGPNTICSAILIFILYPANSPHQSAVYHYRSDQSHSSKQRHPRMNYRAFHSHYCLASYHLDQGNCQQWLSICLWCMLRRTEHINLFYATLWTARGS